MTHHIKRGVMCEMQEDHIFHMPLSIIIQLWM